MPKSNNLMRIGQALTLAAFCGTASPVSAAVLYATSFENPPFTVGPIAGQDGWAEFPGSGAAFVENSFALTGTQAVDVIPALATGQNGPYKTVNTLAPIVEQSAEIYLASSSTQSAVAVCGGQGWANRLRRRHRYRCERHNSRHLRFVPGHR